MPGFNVVHYVLHLTHLPYAYRKNDQNVFPQILTIMMLACIFMAARVHCRPTCMLLSNLHWLDLDMSSEDDDNVTCL